MDKSGHYRSIWHCLCECGNECDATYDSLVRFNDKSNSSGTGSCGCMSSRNFGTPKPNKFELFDDYGIGYCNNGMQFIFDLDDYEKIKNYTWAIRKYNHVYT